MRSLTALVLVVACLSGGASLARASQPQRRPLAGRPLADALRDLQSRGLRIVFSTALVGPEMRVATEPRAATDREALDEILRPHALEAQAGPGGILIVVRARASGDPMSAARSGATIRGIVVDARSATPLPGVLIRLADPGVEKSLTDREGRFELTGLAAGRHTLFASLVGYTLARPVIDLAAGVVQEITIALADGTATYSEQITVTADPFRAGHQAVPTAMVVNSADLLELRGVLSDDPLRAVQALPGVAGGNDFRSEFSVRGSDYRHIGLSVDGMATDWPVHSVRDDASGGSVSLINSDVVDQMALFSGAYPQDRPARTGAWLDFTLREGSRARTQVRGALSMTSASIILEGPIGGRDARGSWLVATRQSFVQWILKRMKSSGSTAFGFSDVQGKAVYDLSPTDRVDVTVIGGQSRLDLQRIDDDPNLVGRGVADAILVTAGWRTTRGGRMTLAQRISASRYGYSNDRADGALLGDGTGNTIAYRGAMTWTTRTSTLLNAGGQVQRDVANDASTRFIERLSPPAVVARPQALDGSRVLWSANARATHTLAGGAAVDVGALVSGATNDAATPSPSPWLAVTIPVRGGLSVRGAAGVYRQHPDLDQTSGTLGGDDVRAERARQFDLTVEHRWRPDARVQVTAYARRERDMLRLAGDEYRLAGGTIVPPSLAPHWGNALDGSSSGFEVLAQRRSATGLGGWIWYGYSRTRYHDRQTGERYFADFDERHSFGAYAQYRLSPVTSLSAKLRIGGNYPIPGYLERRDGDLHVSDARNTVRLPAYARLDVRANRAFNFDSRRLTLFVEVVNLLGRTNYAAGYDGMRVLPDGRVTGSTQRLFPFLPAAGILIEF